MICSSLTLANSKDNKSHWLKSLSEFKWVLLRWPTVPLDSATGHPSHYNIQFAILLTTSYLLVTPKSVLSYICSIIVVPYRMKIVEGILLRSDTISIFPRFTTCIHHLFIDPASIICLFVVTDCTLTIILTTVEIRNEHCTICMSNDHFIYCVLFTSIDK